MANVPTTSWNESSPAGGDNLSAGDNRIRELKTQIREVIDVDHDFPSSGQAADNGQHKRVTLQEQADLGTGATGVPILGAQTVSGVAELVFTTEANEDIQITSGQYILGSSIRFANNTSLYSKDAAGTGVVDLIKSNASDQTVLPTATVVEKGAILVESTAPTTIANQGAIYTKNDGDQTELYFREESNGDEVQITNAGVLNITPVHLGDWEDKSSSYGSQQATTDGFVTGYVEITAGETNYAYFYTDSNSNPTTVRLQTRNHFGDRTMTVPFMFPVKKDDYWKVVCSAVTSIKVYWIPLSE